MNPRQLAATSLLLLIVGCAARHGGAVLDTHSKPVGVGGTISGTVRAVGGEPLVGRMVTVTDTKSGATFHVSTSESGGYTIQVPASTYRLEVELRQGEVITKQPGPTNLNVGDLDAQQDFVLTAR
jgi:hypothetical protein